MFTIEDEAECTITRALVIQVSDSFQENINLVVAAYKDAQED